MIDLSLKDQENLMQALRCARWALDHAADIDHDRKRFGDSLLHQHATAYCIIAVGESTGEVEYDLEKAIPHIAWKKIRGMRNRLAHRPDNINLDIVWGVVTHHFPLLIETLEPMVEAAEPPDQTDRADQSDLDKETK